MMNEGTELMAPSMPRIAIILHICVCFQASEGGEEEDEEDAGAQAGAET